MLDLVSLGIKTFSKRSSERGTCLMGRLLLVLLTVSSVHFAFSDYCSLGGTAYLVGQIFTRPNDHPCTKVRCFYGNRIETYEEGCQYKGICRNVSSTFQDKCETHRCSRTLNNGRLDYTTQFVVTDCEDYYGDCFEPGGQFTYFMNGQLRYNCTCFTRENATVEYTCP